MQKETAEIMENVLHWLIINAKLKLADARKQVVAHEEFIKYLEESKVKMEVFKCLKKK